MAVLREEKSDIKSFESVMIMISISFERRENGSINLE